MITFTPEQEEFRRTVARFVDGYLQNLIPLPASVAPPAKTPPAGGTPSPVATPGGDTLPIFH